MLTPTYIRGEIMGKLLEMARKYINRVTVEELEQNLIDCGVYEIKPWPCSMDTKNMDKTPDSNLIPYSMDDSLYYFKDDSIEYLGGESWIIAQTAS
jgi:hypothetical protein